MSKILGVFLLGPSSKVKYTTFLELISSSALVYTQLKHENNNENKLKYKKHLINKNFKFTPSYN